MHRARRPRRDNQSKRLVPHQKRICSVQFLPGEIGRTSHFLPKADLALPISIEPRLMMFIAAHSLGRSTQARSFAQRGLNFFRKNA